MQRQSALCSSRWLIGLLLVTLVALAATPVVSAAPNAGAARDRLSSSGYPDLDSADPAVRADAVQAIRKAGDQDAVSALIAHLEDPDQRTGLYIAQALVELAPEEIVPLLQLPLLSANAYGRWRAAYVLGERKESRAVSVLARALKDEEVLVSSTAAEALAKIGTPGAIRALISALTSARPSEIHVARNGLRTLGDAAVPALAAALDSGDWRVEYGAATVLEAIGTPSARAALTHLITE